MQDKKTRKMCRVQQKERVDRHEWTRRLQLVWGSRDQPNLGTLMGIFQIKLDDGTQFGDVCKYHGSVVDPTDAAAF